MGQKRAKTIRKPATDVVYVDHFGAARLGGWPSSVVCHDRQETEARARAKLLADAKPPPGCSGEILASPGRGGVASFREHHVLPVGSSDFEVIEEHYPKGCAARTRDVFDVMTDQAKRRGADAPLNPWQIAAGRAYRALSERVAAAGVKCGKAFDPQTPGSGKVDFMDAYMADVQRLELYHRAIGDAVAKDKRRKVPAREGKVWIGDVELREIGKSLITVRALVDAVCIHEKPLSAVLKAHGWSAGGKNQKPLLDALRAALWRMKGV